MATNASDASVLKALDNQKISWYHIKTIIIAGMGFFTDAYDLFAIGLLTKTIGRIYFAAKPSYNPLYKPYYPRDENPCMADVNGLSYGTAGYIPTINTKFNPMFQFCGKYDVNFNTCVAQPGYLPTNGAASCPGPGSLPIAVNAALSGVALCGSLAGQLIWGWLGDLMGRKTVYGYTLIVMVVAAMGQGMSYGNTVKAVIGTLCFWRFILGFGVGGDYPLSATIMSEYSSTATRGAFVGAVFAAQGTGYLAAATFTIIVTAIAQNSVGGNYGYNGRDPYASVPAVSDMVWRTVLAFGAIPAALTIWWRAGMPETARYTALVQGDAHTTAANMGNVLHKKFTDDAAEAIDKRVAASFNVYMQEKPRGMRWSNAVMLFGCASCWFLLDIAFYSQSLFQGTVFTTVGWLPAANTISALEEVFLTSRAQALIALGSIIPGYWATVFTVDRIGRWWIQMGGFFMMTLWMAILAGDYYNLVNNNVNGFVVMYALTFFFANFGPNSTTFIVPSELFAARFRTTCHGIAAASGKAGAIVGAFGFLYASQPAIGTIDPVSGKIQTPAGGGFDSNGKALPPYPYGISLQGALGLLAGINFLGMLMTFFVPETMGRSLEDLSGEDDEVAAQHAGHVHGTEAPSKFADDSTKVAPAP